MRGGATGVVVVVVVRIPALLSAAATAITVDDDVATQRIQEAVNHPHPLVPQPHLLDYQFPPGGSDRRVANEPDQIVEGHREIVPGLDGGNEELEDVEEFVGVSLSVSDDDEVVVPADGAAARI